MKRIIAFVAASSVFLSGIAALGGAVTGFGLGASSGSQTIAKPAFDPAGLYLVPSNGQSLSTGDYSGILIDAAINTHVVQIIDTANQYDGSAETTYYIDAAVTPLRAGKFVSIGGNVSPYPGNIGGEVHDIWMGRTLQWYATNDGGAPNMGFALSNVGQGGAAYSVVGVGGSGNATQSNLNEATVYTRLAVDAGYSAVYPLAQAIVHGEADEALALGDAGYPYEAKLTQWQAYYQAQYSAITGHTEPVPLVVSQQNSFPYPGQGSGWPVVAVEQWHWCLLNPTLCIMSGPKIAVDYSSSTDGVHLSYYGYEELGEKEAEAVWWWWTKGGWSPLWVTSCSIVGSVATCTLHVPVGPLVWDVADTSPHQVGAKYGDNGSAFGDAGTGWTAGKGWEAWTGGVGGTPVGISSVVLTTNPSGTNATATVTVNAVATIDHVSYAMTPDVASGGTGGFTGPTFGGRYQYCRCGNLLDSDPFVGPFSGHAQPNTLVAFQWPWP